MKKEEKNLIVRQLTEKDEKQVEYLDIASGNYVGQWLEDEGYSWGIFENDILVGYCTMGAADDCCRAITDYPGWTFDSLLLGDVYVNPLCRHHGYATRMIEEVIKQKSGNELVFLTLMHDGLIEFYKKFGFVLIAEGVMVLEKRGKK